MYFIGMFGNCYKNQNKMYKQQLKTFLKHINTSNIAINVEYGSICWREIHYNSNVAGIDYIPWYKWRFNCQPVLTSEQLHKNRHTQIAYCNNDTINKLIKKGHYYLRQAPKYMLRKVGSMDTIVRNSKYVIIGDFGQIDPWKKDVIVDLCKIHKKKLYKMSQVVKAIRLKAGCQ